MNTVHSPRISTRQISILVRSREQKAGPFGSSLWSQTTLLPALAMWIPSSLDHFDQNFHLSFWQKVNNDTVFEASILEYERYEGARSFHKYLEF